MYGQGTIGYEKVGKYEYYTLQYYDNNGKKQKKRFPYTREGERNAKKYQKEVQKKKSEGTMVTSTHTVATWTSDFINTYKIGSLKKSSLERILQSFNIIEVSPIANVPLDKLNGAVVQNFYNMLGEAWTDKNGKEHKPLSSSSVSKVHKLLVSAYKKAVQLRMISLNPMDTVDPVKVRTKEMSVFTWREVGRIFRAIRKYDSYKFNNSQRYDYRLLFMMLLETGARVGELLALRWEDINFSTREIYIHTTKARDGQEFNDPKTKSGNRHVPIIFDKLLETPEIKAIRKEKLPTEEAIKLIAKAGGQAFVAHPAKIKELGERGTEEFWNNFEKLIKDLKSKGLKGLECIYPVHTEEEEFRFIQLAGKYHLHISSGTDFHSEDL